MRFPLRAGVVALMALAAVTGSAHALDFKGGGSVKLKATKAQLGIIPPADNFCPGGARMTAWVFTNKPGTVQILIVRDNGNVAGPYQVTTTEGANGVVLGSYKTKMKIVAPIDAQYRVVVAGSDVGSNWVPLVADC